LDGSRRDGHADADVGSQDRRHEGSGTVASTCTVTVPPRVPHAPGSGSHAIVTCAASRSMPASAIATSSARSAASRPASWLGACAIVRAACRAAPSTPSTACWIWPSASTR